MTTMIDCPKFGRGLLLLSSIAFGCTPLGCRGGRPDVPPEIRGIWRTDHPDYAGRHFELRERTLVIATGVGPTENYAVDFVEEIENGENVTHRVHYVTVEGSDYVLSIAYDEGRDRITYTNQPELTWYRE